MKNTNLKWKNMLDGITSRLDTAGNKITQVENVALETIQREAQRGKRLREKMNKYQAPMGQCQGGVHVYHQSIRKGRTEKNVLKKKKWLKPSQV